MSPIPSNSYPSHLAYLMFAPRVKSKLSTLLCDSSDMEESGPELLSPSCGSSDANIDAMNQKNRSKKPTVSRLSFPFVKSSKSPSPKAVKPAPQSLPDTPSTTTRTALRAPSSKQDVGHHPPSTLIKPPPLSYQPNPHRHEYRHRGHSRHALAHIKWFWVMREEEWETRSGPVRLNKPQLDESFLETALDDPLATAQPSVPRRKTPLHPVHQSQYELPPMTIHPRRGDLSSLRDPYCIEVDRSFVTLPTWTIGKTLWMYDVHLASRDRTYFDVQSSDVTDPYDDTESEAESLDAYSSDATLVDSETEGDLSPGGSSSSGIFWDYCVDGKRPMLSHEGYNSSTPPIAQGPLRALSDTDPSPSLESAWSRSAYSEPSTPMRACEASIPEASSACQSSWATDWYRRWQCIIEISNRGRSHDENRKFFIGQDVDDAVDYFAASTSSS